MVAPTSTVSPMKHSHPPRARLSAVWVPAIGATPPDRRVRVSLSATGSFPASFQPLVTYLSTAWHG